MTPFTCQQPSPDILCRCFAEPSWPSHFPVSSSPWADPWTCGQCLLLLFSAPPPCGHCLPLLQVCPSDPSPAASPSQTWSLPSIAVSSSAHHDRDCAEPGAQVLWMTLWQPLSVPSMPSVLCLTILFPDYISAFPQTHIRRWPFSQEVVMFSSCLEKWVSFQFLLHSQCSQLS